MYMYMAISIYSNENITNIVKLTLIRLGFFGYAISGGAVSAPPPPSPEISAVDRAIPKKICTHVAPDIIYTWLRS